MLWHRSLTRSEDSPGTQQGSFHVAYISSHSGGRKKPHVAKIETIMGICGTQIQRRHVFKKTLSHAMAELQELGAVVRWGYGLEVLKGKHVRSGHRLEQ